MIGGNDFCIDICYKNNTEQILNDHRKDLIEILRLLRDHLPRTIVNIVPPPGVILHIIILLSINKNGVFRR